jgi:hypothetical protein
MVELPKKMSENRTLFCLDLDAFTGPLGTINSSWLVVSDFDVIIMPLLDSLSEQTTFFSWN